jgi:hypothetical protein
MLPKAHIVLGAIFSAAVKFVFPEVDWTFILIIFLASFLIDFDHYLMHIQKTGDWNPMNAAECQIKQEKERIRKGEVGPKARKCPFYILHTIEFNLFALLMSYFWEGFFYIFIGGMLHIFLDIVYLIKMNEMHRKEFSLIVWLIKRGKE